MRVAFDDFELDSATAELRQGGDRVALEKQAFDLLLLLAENAERVVSKDEIIEKIWDGRFISDSSISTAVKQIRRAVGDDGNRQATIKTVHGRGFRFVARLNRTPATETTPTPEPHQSQSDGPPSLAVLPFSVLGEGAIGPAIGDAVPAELIAALSRLRWLFIISRGSSFRFRDPATTPETLRKALGVRYALTGTVEILGDMMTVATELARTDRGAVIWSNRYATALGGIHEVRSEIVRDVVGALELHIPFTEAAIARTLDPAQLGAWSHYHIGLQHLYRFNRADNESATAEFHRALDLEPELARAHAGLSFAHWQTAFMHYGDDRSKMLDRAEARANRAAEIDPHDAFTNYNQARVHWLRGDVDGFGDMLDQALMLNPNFAQATYARGLSQVLGGDWDEAQTNLQRAIKLSPLDPLRYAMLTCSSLCLLGLGRVEEAAPIAEQACHLPGAHFYIDMIAAAVHHIAGNTDKAAMRAARARERQPSASLEMYRSSFPHQTKPGAQNDVQKALETLGF